MEHSFVNLLLLNERFDVIKYDLLVGNRAFPGNIENYG